MRVCATSRVKSVRLCSVVNRGWWWSCFTYASVPPVDSRVSDSSGSLSIPHRSLLGACVGCRGASDSVKGFRHCRGVTWVVGRWRQCRRVNKATNREENVGSHAMIAYVRRWEWLAFVDARGCFGSWTCTHTHTHLRHHPAVVVAQRRCTRTRNLDRTRSVAGNVHVVGRLSLDPRAPSRWLGGGCCWTLARWSEACGSSRAARCSWT